ncbi:DUF4292 domain-containing protein [Gracilimonas tropica]|uniref:DUF4292 domain-containing protein n=1 Tax=Gracilimonas tropica TaxID=454600 RepID=UPI0003740A6F|nr:DUF4292 domain-containing protein [Gracilimonas tropica]
MNSISRFSLLMLFLSVAILSACSTSKSVVEGDFRKSDLSKAEVAASIPNYENTLRGVSGKGRALVSEPGNSDRVTIDFEADRTLSLLTIQNRIGIEGGQMLVEADSILIYDRLDKTAQKVSIYDGRITSLNELASINILDLLNFKVEAEQVGAILESNNSIQLRLKNGAQVYVDPENRTVQRVEQPIKGRAPYSRIIYEGYGVLEGFTLPRKITIFSSDGDSRVVFLIRSLEVNPSKLNLEIDLPDNIKIQRI